MRKAIVFLFLVAAAVALQKQPIPPFPGDGNPQHKGQPTWCANFDTKENTRNCECQAMNADACKHEDEYGPDSYGEDNSPRCKVHCRRDACQCQRHCST